MFDTSGPTPYAGGVVKTRKVQVTLDEAQYASLHRLAARKGRKLAAVVREAIEQYCIEPETRRRQLKAIDDLYAMEPVPAPADWAAWEREYSRLKTREHTLDSDGSRGSGAGGDRPR